MHAVLLQMLTSASGTSTGKALSSPLAAGRTYVRQRRPLLCRSTLSSMPVELGLDLASCLAWTWLGSKAFFPSWIRDCWTLL